MHYVVYLWTLVHLPNGKTNRTRQTIQANDLTHARGLCRALEGMSNDHIEHSCTVMARVSVPLQASVYIPVEDLSYFAEEVAGAAATYAKDCDGRK